MSNSFVVNLKPLQRIESGETEEVDQSVILKGFFDADLDNYAGDIHLYINKACLEQFFTSRGYTMDSTIDSSAVLNPADELNPNAERYIKITFSADGGGTE